jgi:cell division cycle 20-like protein 1, cofactor of APC complex
MSAFNRVSSSSDMDIEGSSLGLPKPSIGYPASPRVMHSQFDLSSSLASPARPLRSPGVRRSNSLNSSGEFSSGSLNNSASNFMQQQNSQPMVYSDRFIPSRNASDLDSLVDSMDFDDVNGCENYGRNYNSTSDSSRESKQMMNNLLRSELLGIPGGGVGGGGSSSTNGEFSMRNSYDSNDNGSNDLLRSSTESRCSNGSGGSGLDMRGSGNFTGQNVLKFRSDRRRSSGGGDSGSISSNTSGGSGDTNSTNSLGLGLGVGVGASGVGLVGGLPGSPSNLGSSSMRKSQRKISKTPYKVLDAPALQDDYYLNLLDWGSENTLSVALGSNVYLWSACTSKVTKLCDTGTDNPITSICWAPQGTHLAVGTNSGKIQLWDVQASKCIREMTTHSSRVGSMAWSSSLLASGSRDRSIMMHDARIHGGSGSEPATIGSSNTSSSSVVHQCTSHRQEVCGLKWSPDEKMLASGGNDNKLYVWAMNHADPTTPLCRFNDHNAAVKAVAWSPHQNGLLASGGGTADRNIRFWNTLNGNGIPLHRIDTGSQVCNLMWSKNVNEIVSTHGYSLNQIIVWKYPSMQKVTTLTGHSLRVLYLAMSPDGQAVVTGAGDETLRFWNLFPSPRSSTGRSSGLLFPGGDIR